MKEKSAVVGIGWKFVLLVAGVVLLSLLSVSLWQEKPEKPGEMAPLVLREGMTVGEFGRENNLPNEVIQQAFGLKSREDLGRKLEGLNLPATEITARAAKARTLAAEYESKNWFKIPLKFALWILFLVGAFILMRRGKITHGLRKGLYLAALVLFGVLLGADPGPMGTVKDAIVLYGEKGVIFPPRMIALVLFLLMVVLANKFI